MILIVILPNCHSLAMRKYRANIFNLKIRGANFVVVVPAIFIVQESEDVATALFLD